MKHDKAVPPKRPVDIFAIAVTAGLLLATMLWSVDALFGYLWLENANGSLWTVFFPLHDPHEMLMRICYSSVLIVSGVAVGSVMQRLVRLRHKTDTIAENLRITLDSIGDAVIATDINGHVAQMNPVAEELTGWTLKDAGGKPLLDIFHTQVSELI